MSQTTASDARLAQLKAVVGLLEHPDAPMDASMIEAIAHLSDHPVYGELVTPHSTRALKALVARVASDTPSGLSRAQDQLASQSLALEAANGQLKEARGYCDVFQRRISTLEAQLKAALLSPPLGPVRDFDLPRVSMADTPPFMPAVMPPGAFVSSLTTEIKMDALNEPAADEPGNFVIDGDWKDPEAQTGSSLRRHPYDPAKAFFLESGKGVTRIFPDKKAAQDWMDGNPPAAAKAGSAGT